MGGWRKEESFSDYTVLYGLYVKWVKEGPSMIAIWNELLN